MAAKSGDRTPLLAEEGVVRHRGEEQKRKGAKKQERWKSSQDPDWDHSLPYGGKVYLARKKKSDPLWIRITEVSKN